MHKKTSGVPEIRFRKNDPNITPSPADHDYCGFQPFNRRCRISSCFQFLLAHQVPPFKHVKDKMSHQSAIFENS